MAHWRRARRRDFGRGVDIPSALFVLACILMTAASCHGATAWPFTPRSAHLVMLMDKTHAARSSDGRQIWALSEDLSYRTHAGDTVTEPKGMVTDLASIPRLVQGLLPSDGPYAQAAVVHDGCYVTRGAYEWPRKAGPFRGRSRAQPYSRAECDGLLDQAMADVGVSWPARWTIWAAVRLGGAGGWGR